MRSRTIAWIVLLMFVGAACSSDDASTRAREPSARPRATEAPGQSTLKKAHDFSLKVLGPRGGTFKLSDHFGELPIVLNFWAPW